MKIWHRSINFYLEDLKYATPRLTPSVRRSWLPISSPSPRRFLARGKRDLGHIQHHRYKRIIAGDSDQVHHARFAKHCHGALEQWVGDKMLPMQGRAEVVDQFLIRLHVRRALVLRQVVGEDPRHHDHRSPLHQLRCLDQGGFLFSPRRLQSPGSAPLNP